ncbi:MAG: lantibiotic dehydratase [Pseudonocardiaceae bacterium]
MGRHRVGAQERGRWYRHVDAALLRASAHTVDVVPECWPDPDDGTKIEQWCAWLGEVWAQAPVAEAIAMASPALADRVEAVCAGLRPEAGQVRRMVMSVARYLVRMRGRATPFGAFAGVAPLRFGAQVSVRWTDGHRARTRADAVWLAGVIARLESYPGLRQRLPVMVNDLVVVRGERLVVPWQPRPSTTARHRRPLPGPARAPSAPARHAARARRRRAARAAAWPNRGQRGHRLTLHSLATRTVGGWPSCLLLN